MPVSYRALRIACIVLLAGATARADSNWLYGIHWWGYTQGQAIDNVPCQMLDCATHGGWTLETIITNSASWWQAPYFAGLYTDLYNNKNMTIITRIDYNWGETVPSPTNPDHAGWHNTVVNTVNTLRHGCHIWLIGNEPNITIEGDNWPNQQVTPAGYAEIYRRVRNAIHNNASSSPAGQHIVLVAAPSPGGIIPGIRWKDGNQWLGEVLDLIPNNEVDGVALHAYGAVASFHASYASALAVIDSKGLKHVPTYITEWNIVTGEATMAQTVRDCFADLNNWNNTPGNHNVRCLCWFVYDSNQQAGGGWNQYSIEYLRNNGSIPLGNPSNVWTAFEQTVDQRYPAGQVGTPGLTSMTRSPASFTKNIFEGDNAANDIFTIKNNGSGPMNYSITDNATWLSVSPTNGSSSGETDSINVIYSTAGLAPNVYNATITINATAATNSPQTIAVNLTVQSSPFAQSDFDKDGDVDQTDFGKFQSCMSGSGIPQEDPNCAAAKLDADGDVDLDDFGIFQACMSGANIPVKPICID